jgi:hypothetical protein
MFTLSLHTIEPSSPLFIMPGVGGADFGAGRDPLVCNPGGPNTATRAPGCSAITLIYSERDPKDQGAAAL